MDHALSASRVAMQPDGSRLIKFFFGEELPFVSHGRGVFAHMPTHPRPRVSL